MIQSQVIRTFQAEQTEKMDVGGVGFYKGEWLMEASCAVPECHNSVTFACKTKKLHENKICHRCTYTLYQNADCLVLKRDGVFPAGINYPKDWFKIVEFMKEEMLKGGFEFDNAYKKYLEEEK